MLDVTGEGRVRVREGVSYRIGLFLSSQQGETGQLVSVGQTLFSHSYSSHSKGNSYSHRKPLNTWREKDNACYQSQQSRCI